MFLFRRWLIRNFPTINRTEKIPLPDDLVKEVLPTGKQVHLGRGKALVLCGYDPGQGKTVFERSQGLRGSDREKDVDFHKRGEFGRFRGRWRNENNQLLRDLAILNAPANGK
jgi:hypothetical protein